MNTTRPTRPTIAKPDTHGEDGIDQRQDHCPDAPQGEEQDDQRCEQAQAFALMCIWARELLSQVTAKVYLDTWARSFFRGVEDVLETDSSPSCWPLMVTPTIAVWPSFDSWLGMSLEFAPTKLPGSVEVRKRRDRPWLYLALAEVQGRTRQDDRIRIGIRLREGLIQQRLCGRAVSSGQRKRRDIRRRQKLICTKKHERRNKPDADNESTVQCASTPQRIQPSSSRAKNPTAVLLLVPCRQQIRCNYCLMEKPEIEFPGGEPPTE